MQDSLKRLYLPDSTIMLALFTAVLFFLLYLSNQNNVLPVALAAVYAVAGIIALIIRANLQNTGTLEYDRQQVNNHSAIKPLTTVEMPAALVNQEDSGTISVTLEEITMHIRETTEGLVKASYAINSVTTQQSSSATEQADVIHTTNNLMDDFLELTERVSDQARTVSHTAQEAAQVSRSGQSAIQQSIASMDDIRQQVEAIGDTILTLAKLTRRIDEIITSVSEIATQSNLLALNASIEAARAGTHGRGFAVVADEVRVLSQQSTQSAAQVRTILGEIQKAMKATLEATRTGLGNVDEGVARTREANTVMIRLAQSVSAAHESVRDIYEIIQQQSENMEDISVSMDRIERITQQNLASTRTVETVSSNLTRLASDLQRAVGESTGMPTLK